MRVLNSTRVMGFMAGWNVSLGFSTLRRSGDQILGLRSQTGMTNWQEGKGCRREVSPTKAQMKAQANTHTGSGPAVEPSGRRMVRGQQG